MKTNGTASGDGRRAYVVMRNVLGSESDPDERLSLHSQKAAFDLRRRRNPATPSRRRKRRKTSFAWARVRVKEAEPPKIDPQNWTTVDRKTESTVKREEGEEEV